MKSTALFLLICAFLTFGFQALTAQPGVNTCVDCHVDLGDEFEKLVKKFNDDVHNKQGLSCAGCHGGDPTAEDPDESMDPKKGFVGAPSTLEIPKFCGECHSNPRFIRTYNPSLPTDQMDKYYTSHHGQSLKHGDEKVAQCVSCHGTHNIRKVKDPISKVYPTNVPKTCAICHSNEEYMAPYALSTDQYSQYRNSIHGEALLKRGDTGAPACNDCHGNHAATPPGFASIGRVCFQCHLAEGELFTSSPHKPAFDALEVEECVFCHSAHDIQHPTGEEIGIHDEAVCVKCHGEGDNGYDAAAKMREAIDNLSKTYESSGHLLADAEQKGVEVSEALFNLMEVRDALVNSRKLVHAFNPETVLVSVDDALVMATELRTEGEQAVEEVKHRRSGYWVFSLFTIFLIVTLYAKTRDMER